VTFLGDVVVRARGLARHLLDRQSLERLAHAPDRSAFGEALAQHGYPAALAEPGSTEGVAAAIDAAISRGGQRRLALLVRWLGSRRSLFIAVLEEEERRILRILLRRAAAGDPPPFGVGSLAPTAALPRRTLASLSLARDPRDLVQGLLRIGHACAEPLARALEASGVDLIALETALDRAFAERARRGARRGGATCARGWPRASISRTRGTPCSAGPDPSSRAAGGSRVRVTMR
jgi:vacuolar-type H+-ATPase subunit C/Vma6